MVWLTNFQTSFPVVHAVVVLSVVIMMGLILGGIKIRGVSLGIAGIIFSGLFVGHWKVSIDPEILGFARDFGLILFVYTIGMQVGPGLLTSLRRQGLVLNVMAVSVVLLGAVLAIAVACLANIDMAAVVGMFSGATTNTPALGAAQEAFKSLSDVSVRRSEMPALGYAVTYPCGVVGSIFVILMFKHVFRINVSEEVEKFQKERKRGREQMGVMNLVVDNRNLDGLSVGEIPSMEGLGIVVSRIKSASDGRVSVAREETRIHVGDVLLAVGTKARLEQFRLIVGKEAPVDLMKEPGEILTTRVVVTKKEVLGKSLRELGFGKLFGVAVTRVTRADMEMPASPDLEFHFGDTLHVVGEKTGLAEATRVLGNSAKQLQHTNLIAMFLGISVGLLFGIYPISVGHMPVPLRLGLAGGPLLAALLFSQMGRIGPVVFYMPENANLALRELGIVLFLACVGLRAGEHIMGLLVHGDGFVWMAYGAMMTFVPIVIVGFVARRIFALNFMDLCGLLAGSVTNPAALQFANSMSSSDEPSVGYVTVYPLTMFLRILVAQLLVLFFCR